MLPSPAISHRVKQHPDNPLLIHSVSVYVSKIIASNVPYDIMCSDSCYPLEGRLLTLSEVLTWHNTIVLITCLSLVVLWTMLFYVCTGCRLKFIHLVMVSHFFCRWWLVTSSLCRWNTFCLAETGKRRLTECTSTVLIFGYYTVCCCKALSPKSSKQGYLVSHHT